MHQIVSSRSAKKNFDVPSSVVKMSYCKDSGKLMDDACLFDPRGDRCQVGWFTLGNIPNERCDRHVLCHADTEGGISHGFCSEYSSQRVGLIRAERHFPIQILVSDAQYVYRGDPASYTPNPNTGQAYFEGELQDFCGRSFTELPYNRSCPVHQMPPPAMENEIGLVWQRQKKNRIFSSPAA